MRYAASVVALSLLIPVSVMAQPLPKNGAETKTLTVEQAEALAKHKGDLTLRGSTLSVEQAEALAKHEGRLVLLYGYTFLWDMPAEPLAVYEGSLRFTGLTYLSDNAAEALAKHDGML